MPSSHLLSNQALVNASLVACIGADESSGEQAYMTEMDMAASMQHPMQPIADAIAMSNQQMTLALGDLVNTINENHNRPKQVVRGEG